MNCERIAMCPFFGSVLSDMPTMAERMKARFCWGDHESCARKRAAKVVGADNVPPDMFPNDEARLIRLLAEAHSDARPKA